MGGNEFLFDKDSKCEQYFFFFLGGGGRGGEGLVLWEVSEAF